MKPEALRQVLEAGLLAPSADNEHRLRYERAGRDAWHLRATDRARWSEQPHRRLLALLSCGAVIENLSLRALEFGLATTVRWFPGDDAVAEFEWSPADQRPDPLATAIESRHCNRRFYRRAPLQAATLERLSAAAAVPGAGVAWLDGERRRVALQALRLAETERFRRRRLHEELFAAVRFDIGWRDSAPHGLPPGSLEIEPPLRPMFASLRHWPLMRALQLVGTHRVLGLRAGDLPCRLAPHLAAVFAHGPSDDAAALQAGRSLQRLWLAATLEGLALQPFAAAVALTRQAAGDGWVAPAVQARLVGLLERLVDAPRRPYMLLRLGRAPAPTVVTGRRPLRAHLDPAQLESAGLPG